MLYVFDSLNRTGSEETFVSQYDFLSCTIILIHLKESVYKLHSIVNLTILVALYVFDLLKITYLYKSFVRELNYMGLLKEPVHKLHS